MEIKLDKITELRKRTNLSITVCKKALEENTGDIEMAITYLKEKSLLDMMEGKEKEALEGAIFSYIHTNNRVGVLLEVNCQTDFVARTDEFKQFCKDIAMQIAGNSPPAEYIEDKFIPGMVLIKQLEFFQQKTMEEKSLSGAWKDLPMPIKLMIDKISAGRLIKWKKDICLLDQPFVKDPKRVVRSLVADLRQKTGEQITIRRFTRYELGEGLGTKNNQEGDEAAKLLQAKQELYQLK